MSAVDFLTGCIKALQNLYKKFRLQGGLYWKVNLIWSHPYEYLGQPINFSADPGYILI